MVIPYNIFKWNSKSKSGGLSGSASVEDNSKQKFQFKFSVLLKKSLGQKAKAHAKGFTDHENVQEVIAGDIARAVASNLKSNLQSPEIDFVGQNRENTSSKDNKAINIASKYLPDFQDLEGFFKSTHNDASDKIRHLQLDLDSITSKMVGKDAILGGKDLPDNIKQGIADGMALNALFGNMDVNAKGNMGIVGANTTDGKAAIIDFGHAFDNLIAGPKAFGGGRKDNNGILDFINRDKVLKTPKGGASKIWRDYKGLIHSEEFVQALNNVGDSKEQLQEGLNNGKEKLYSLNDQLEDKSMLIDSLQRMNRNIGAGNVKSYSSDVSSSERLIDQTMENLKVYSTKRLGEMKGIAKTIELQRKIDHHIQESKNPDQLGSLMKESFALQDKDRKISWVRNQDHKPGRSSFDDYYLGRKAFLEKKKKAIIRPAWDRIKKSAAPEVKPEQDAPQTPKKKKKFVSRFTSKANKKVMFWVQRIKSMRSKPKDKVLSQ